MNASAASLASAPPAEGSRGAPLPMPEFIALVAALMSLTALGIDAMLPALPAIGNRLGAPTENARQLVITAFVIGFGIGQLLHGPLADRFGRRRDLIASLCVYALANAACALAGTFEQLIVARVLGGIAVASARVVTVAMVRDCYHGRAMARVMSIAFIVFMIVPVLAPAFGAGVLLFGGWRDIFWTIAGVTVAVLLWFALRMPETMHPEDRKSLAPSRIVSAWRVAATDRWSLGYTLAASAMMGGLYGYLNSVQQIVADTFGRPNLLVVLFAVTAMTMAAANLFNARLVMRVGTRRLGHGAVLVMIAASAVHLAIGLAGAESVVSFAVLQAITLGCFGLASANFSSMAMENMGHVAGTASSVQGFTSVSVGAIVGAVIGQSFDGTTVPLAVGFLLASLAALAAVLVTERGRLFAAR